MLLDEMQLEIAMNPANVFSGEWLGFFQVRYGSVPEILAQISAIRREDLQQRQAAYEASQRDPGWSLDPTFPGIATVALKGPLSRSGSSLSGQGSTEQFGRALDEIRASSSIKAAAIRMSTPGGTVSGTGEAWSKVQQLAAVKPVLIYGQDVVASAGYHIASAGTQLWSSENDLWGSIGTYMQVVDSSKAAADQGYKVHIIKAGAFKGMGAMGTSLTDDQKSELQRQVNSLNQLFVEHVANGRNIPVATVADKWNTGQDWIAKEAKDLGLIDQVGTWEQALEWLSSQVSGKTIVPVASKAQEKPKMALSPNEIAQACKGLDPKKHGTWLLEQSMDDSLTDIEQAKERWMDHLAQLSANADAAAQKAAIDADSKAAATTKALEDKVAALELQLQGSKAEDDDAALADQLKPDGNEPVEGGGSESAFATQGLKSMESHPFAQNLAKLMKSEGLTRDQALLQAAAADQRGYADWLQTSTATNNKVKRAAAVA